MITNLPHPHIQANHLQAMQAVSPTFLSKQFFSSLFTSLFRDKRVGSRNGRSYLISPLFYKQWTARGLWESRAINAQHISCKLLFTNVVLVRLIGRGELCGLSKIVMCQLQIADDFTFKISDFGRKCKM